MSALWAALRGPFSDHTHRQALDRIWRWFFEEEARGTMTTPEQWPPTVDSTDMLAARLHAGQVDKAGAPYIEHVRAVAAKLQPYGEYAYMAGLLHDLVEDTWMNLAALRLKGYPEVVVEAVDAVSRRDGEAYEDLIARAAAHPLGCLVKIADNQHNSDEERLMKLPKHAASRLRGKYARARKVLMPALEEHARRARRPGGGGLLFGPEMVSLEGHQ